MINVVSRRKVTKNFVKECHLTPLNSVKVLRLIARASRAYRFCPACLSLVAIKLIAHGPSAYRSSGLIDNCTCKITTLAKGVVRLLT